MAYTGCLECIKVDVCPLKEEHMELNIRGFPNTSFACGRIAYASMHGRGCYISGGGPGHKLEDLLAERELVRKMYPELRSVS